jgi:hypothetical protein
MEIICKRRIQFNLYEFYKERSTGDKLAKVIDRFTINPSIRPQQIPDWVNDTSELDEYIACGVIVIIGERPAPSMKPTTTEPQQTAQPTAEKKEEERLLNTPISELTGGRAVSGHYPTTAKGWPSANSI